ncbi:MAG: nuclear transport factor 2 family protein [Dehalococcoidia bacterium]
MPESPAADEVREANDRFYRAFESLDVDQMSAAWAGEDSITCVHPGWPLVKGRGAVMGSWARIFESTTLMQFTITGAEITVEGDWAWVSCTENITSVVDGRVTEGKVQATNIYVKRTGRWLAVHHHGSPVVS